MTIASGGLAAQPVAQPAAQSLSLAETKQLEVLQGTLDRVSDSTSHPDQMYRNVGLRAYKDGDKELAMRDFLKASRYADKLSQSMVAMMYWDGDGIAVDRPRGYAWMDLAASRGYRDLLLQREAYWRRLSNAERKQALEIGQQVYAEYSDQRGLDRLVLRFAMARANVTGSHLGWAGNGVTEFPTAGLMHMRLDFSRLYDPALWQPANYERLKDLQWQLNSPLGGHVVVGPLQALPGPLEAAPPK
jgi:hypothetical protein